MVLTALLRHRTAGYAGPVTWTAPEVAVFSGSTAADERAMLGGYLAWHRSVLLHKCAGLSGDELARRTVALSTLSLLGLVREQQPAGEILDDTFVHADLLRERTDGVVGA